MGNIKTSTKLHILILLFVFGFISLFTVNQVFSGLIEELNQKTKSYEKKIKIAEFVSEDIQGLKALFFELSIATNTSKSRQLVKAKIENLISNINDSLLVLQKGGVLKRQVELNIIGANKTVSEVAFDPKISGQTVSLEAIDIQPKLLQLSEMLTEVETILDHRNEHLYDEDYRALAEVNLELARYYKTTPAFFNRMSENIKRLLYEGDIELKSIKEERLKKQDEYLRIKLLLTFSVIVITTLFGFWISQIINKENHQLEVANKDLEIKENFVKAILNGQENMVIVSDGLQMIDANEAIANFFYFLDSIDEFKSKYDCICDLFEYDVPDDSYINKKLYGDISWLEYMLLHKEKHFKVILNNGRENHHFSIVANKKSIGQEGQFIVVVVVLNDITNEVNSRKELAELNNNLEHMIDVKTKELQDLNNSLETRIDEELEKNREKDKQMIQQSRFAALGEMIGNIAHQWRQPLSAISSTASGIELQMEIGVASNEDIKKSYSDIKNYVQFLTQTIEDFRGFFKEDKTKVDFDMRNVLKNALAITNATYKDNNINVKLNISDEPLTANGMPSELAQAFLNILNNARDAIIEKKPNFKGIYIYSQNTENENTLYFQDNAGGIPDGILEKIFDPYFTTKHQSQGTGIGLYMSKDIVEKNMHGSLSVKNIVQELDGVTYSGACFRISLPKNKNIV
ncbi:MAG: ATP-binding protein [Arcobacteraceae bacterium]|jgi:signal transduction histidine kinase|nr:ATP-binding protein [Arcobacteraceae bacterium]